MLASTLLGSNSAPSTYAPRPASPLANPLGSWAVIVVPLVITLTFCTYGLRVDITALGAKRNA